MRLRRTIASWIESPRAWPMCSAPVTLGGGMTTENGGRSLPARARKYPRSIQRCAQRDSVSAGSYAPEMPNGAARSGLGTVRMDHRVYGGPSPPFASGRDRRRVGDVHRSVVDAPARVVDGDPHPERGTHPDRARDVDGPGEGGHQTVNERQAEPDPSRRTLGRGIRLV